MITTFSISKVLLVTNPLDELLSCIAYVCNDLPLSMSEEGGIFSLNPVDSSFLIQLSYDEAVHEGMDIIGLTVQISSDNQILDGKLYSWLCTFINHLKSRLN